MKGTRPLTTEEIIAVSNQFNGTFEIRNRSLFMLGISVGGRISRKTLHSISDTSTEELIVELQARGIDIQNAIEQSKTERRQLKKQRNSKVIPFPKSTTG